MFAFLVNFFWEIIASQFYVGLAQMQHSRAVRCCFTATVGDTLIALVAYGSIAAVAKRTDWLREARITQILGYVGVGMVITVAVERLSVYTLDRWAYQQGIPTLGGVGVVPLLQWLVVPPAVLWLAWRHQRSAR